jgi:hypothetical protein
MMNRGRGRRASSLVPGNGEASAPALARRPVHGGPAGLRDELDDMLGRIRSTRHSNPVFKCPACGHIGRGADPQSVFAPRYWRWLALALPRVNRHGRLRRPGLLTEMRRDLICMATPRRQSPLDSQGARMPMNGEPRPDLYSADHLNGIARVTTISRPPADVDSSPLGD